MLLDEWLFKERLSNKEFAGMVDVNRNYMGMIVTGRIAPGPKLIKAIVKKTGGEVTERELVEDREKLKIKPKDRK